MKRKATLVVLGAGLGVLPLAAGRTSGDCSKWDGAWEYLVEGQTGMFIVHGDYGVGLLTPADRAPLAAAATPAERLAARGTTQAWAWHIQCTGNRMDFRTLYTADPNGVGAEGWSDITEEPGGTEISWTYYDSAGQRQGLGRARRME